MEKLFLVRDTAKKINLIYIEVGIYIFFAGVFKILENSVWLSTRFDEK